MSRRIALASLVLLTGCAQEGDFGRPAAGTWNAAIDTTGTITARLRDEPASLFAMTDDERTLRDRAWRYLMPAQARDAFLDILANLTRTRVFPPNWRDDDPDAYYEGLVGQDFRSQVSRYNRLSEDAVADGRLLPLFAATAQRVIEADSLRLRSLPFAKSLDDEAVREAAMRVAENRCLIAWVRLETGVRVTRYRYALEHLVVEVPGREALAAEHSINFLEGRRPILAGLLPPETETRCGLVPAPAVGAAATGLAGRVVAKY